MDFLISVLYDLILIWFDNFIYKFGTYLVFFQYAWTVPQEKQRREPYPHHYVPYRMQDIYKYASQLYRKPGDESLPL